MSPRAYKNAGYLVVLAVMLAVPVWLALREPATTSEANAPLPSELRGPVRVLDADTWELHGHRLRIDGLDAPEFDQECGAPQALWPCGRDAIRALRAHLGEREVHCRLHGIDRYQRPLATCFMDGENLQRWLVRNGWAVAYGTDGDGEDYTLDEIQAQHARVGIWRDRFTRPSQWRRDAR